MWAWVLGSVRRELRRPKTLDEEKALAAWCLRGEPEGAGWLESSLQFLEQREEIELKSLILAQIELWRHALHMQVER